MGMDPYLLIPFLGEWTSIYQLFWCSPGVQGFDTLPDTKHIHNSHFSQVLWSGVDGAFRSQVQSLVGTLSRSPKKGQGSEQKKGWKHHGLSTPEKKGLQEVRMFRTLDFCLGVNFIKGFKETPFHIPKKVLIVVLCRVQQFQKLPLTAFAAPAVVSSLKPHESYPAESRFWKTYPAERSGNPWLHKDCQEPKLPRQRFRRYS